MDALEHFPLLRVRKVRSRGPALDSSLLFFIFFAGARIPSSSGDSAVALLPVESAQQLWEEEACCGGGWQPTHRVRLTDSRCRANQGDPSQAACAHRSWSSSQQSGTLGRFDATPRVHRCWLDDDERSFTGKKKNTIVTHWVV